MNTEERRGLLRHVTPRTHFDVGSMGDGHEREQAAATALVVIADVLTEGAQPQPSLKARPPDENLRRHKIEQLEELMLAWVNGDRSWTNNVHGVVADPVERMVAIAQMDAAEVVKLGAAISALRSGLLP